jgi:hypothetical protein
MLTHHFYSEYHHHHHPRHGIYVAVSTGIRLSHLIDEDTVNSTEPTIDSQTTATIITNNTELSNPKKILRCPMLR